jgi:hypothetical protein
LFILHTRTLVSRYWRAELFLVARINGVAVLQLPPRHPAEFVINGESLIATLAADELPSADELPCGTAAGRGVVTRSGCLCWQPGARFHTQDESCSLDSDSGSGSAQTNDDGREGESGDQASEPDDGGDGTENGWDSSGYGNAFVDGKDASDGRKKKGIVEDLLRLAGTAGSIAILGGLVLVGIFIIVCVCCKRGDSGRGTPANAKSKSKSSASFASEYMVSGLQL